MKLETARLTLRALTETDFEALYRVLDDSDIRRHKPYTFDEQRVRRWITCNQERYRIFGFGLWAVCLKESGELIGDCGLTLQRVNGILRPELGYHLRADWRGKGLAREAAAAVRDWTFTHTPFGEICSCIKADNAASAAVAIAYGARLADEYVDEENERTCVYVCRRADVSDGRRDAHA